MRVSAGKARIAVARRTLGGEPTRSGAGSVLALQRAAGHRAVRALIQRAPTEAREKDLVVKVGERVARWRRGITQTQDIRNAADKLIETELGSKPIRRPGARRNGLAEIARRGGPEADRARRLGKALADLEADLDKRAKDVAEVADDLIRSQLGSADDFIRGGKRGARPNTPRARQNALGKIAGEEGQVGKLAAELQQKLREIDAEIAARRPAPGRASKFAKGEAAAGKAAAEAEATAGKAAGKVESSAVGGVGKAAAKAEQEVVELAAKTSEKLWKRVARKLGEELFEALVPGPLDALELMGDVAAAYEQVWQEIRTKRLRSGFAVGLAAYLLERDWESGVLGLAHPAADRDVALQVVGAVGISENAFNEGLTRGFMYGQRHDAAQTATLRDKAFNALAAAGKTIGTEEGFTDRDVYRLAAVLLKTADGVLAEAERRRTARLAQQRKDWGLPQPGRGPIRPL